MKSFLVLNPFICRSKHLPDNLVLMVKLIIIGLLIKGYVFQLSKHFLPFFPIFDYLGSPQEFKRTLQLFFLIGSFGILFSHRIRTSCLIMAFVLGISVLSSKIKFTNVNFFCACMFFLTALVNDKNSLVFFRYQMAIVYFGAGINKLFDPDWRSGQYFEYWMGSIIKRDTYIYAASFLPSMMFSKIMCWLTITTELFLSAGFLLRPFHYVAIWVGVYFHSMAFLLSWNEFGVFTIAILSSYLILFPWPETLTVGYNESMLGHRWAKKIFQTIDWDRRIHWTIQNNWQVTVFDRTFSGLLALKRLVLYTPCAYFLYALILALPDPLLWIKLKVVQLVLILFLPWPEIIELVRKRQGTQMEVSSA